MLYRDTRCTARVLGGLIAFVKQMIFLSMIEVESSLPNFIVLGASKSGTTSLYFYLRQHPDIFMSPIKETNFFALEGVNLPLQGPGDAEWYQQSITNLDNYRSIFSDVQNEKAVGEVSPTYLHSRYAPKNIRSLVPDVKLIAILRNPVERAYSHYRHHKREGRETADSFEEALNREESRLQKGWFWPRYKYAGFYYKQLRRYYNLFSEDQIRIYLFEEYKHDTEYVVKDIFEFIGVDPSFSPNVNTKHNVSGRPRFNVLDTLLAKENILRSLVKPLLPVWIKQILVNLKNANLAQPDPMAEETKLSLIELYSKDIQRLERLIDRDLSHWLN